MGKYLFRKVHRSEGAGGRRRASARRRPCPRNGLCYSCTCGRVGGVGRLLASVRCLGCVVRRWPLGCLVGLAGGASKIVGLAGGASKIFCSPRRDLAFGGLGRCGRRRFPSGRAHTLPPKSSWGSARLSVGNFAVSRPLLQKPQNRAFAPDGGSHF